MYIKGSVVSFIESTLGRTHQSGWETEHVFFVLPGSTVWFKVIEERRWTDDLGYNHTLKVVEHSLILETGVEILVRETESGYRPGMSCHYSNEEHSGSVEFLSPLPEDGSYSKNRRYIKDAGY
ncbi:hypothetical protein A2382_04260 [Candidatus Woesebacteria bacterium RIFOXYB1_FULL_38_16]|uniref:Uncharacterized protein n=1 Tax=Candidatus Woesebacteria bacterium RIFOXYB1_FULL_38_16 TaxID=1802538 RepID=A0A1F8CTX8_9BACT|nr:MAG: hypothetical protein A2191_04340 [Candidatus Woesebacteria bacterium RIFOXYA1_FULL_38_9]OGM79784.1 MAG: hypothetical protein A2382_04260 [Candidatus Woesebacteria bacterium RIFOXYB1_FULL_38_16]